MNKKVTKRILLSSLALAVLVPAGMIYRQYKADVSSAYRRVASGGKLIETACGPVQYTEYGEGPPMLMVHGAGGGYDQGETFAKLFGGNYRWIAPSRFGFLGQTTPEGADSNQQADTYACLLDALGIERVGVVGVSMGGPSSLLFAQRHPERTDSLVLISAASHANPPRPALIAALFNVFLHDPVFWSMARYSPGGLLVALGVPPEIQKELSPQDTERLQHFLESIVPMGARRQGQLLEQHMSEYDAEQIRDIQAPTLVFHARDDTLVAFEQGEYSAGKIPGAMFIPIEKGGHLALMLDGNAWVREKILEFLDLHTSRSR
jgi:2-hydroxy-6-oxonona-2,4-dienedioate hydrolase